MHTRTIKICYKAAILPWSKAILPSIKNILFYYFVLLTFPVKALASVLNINHLNLPCLFFDCRCSSQLGFLASSSWSFHLGYFGQEQLWSRGDYVSTAQIWGQAKQWLPLDRFSIVDLTGKFETSPLYVKALDFVYPLLFQVVLSSCN